MKIQEIIYCDNGDIMILNPNEKIVEKIKERCELNDNLCPCVPDSITRANVEDYTCPCKKCRTEGKCCCTLYLNEKTIISSNSC